MSADPNPPASPKVPPDQQEGREIHEMHAPIMREQAEPRDGFEPIPPWTALVFGALLFWGGYYLATYSGDFRFDVYDENRRPGDASGPAGAPDPLVRGEKLFATYCSSCHLASGQGQAGQNIPPLAGSEWILEAPARATRIALNGLQGPVTVQGKTYNGAMPNLNLKDDQVAAIMTYVRQAWDNKQGSITTEQVAHARQHPPRATQWTATELLALPAEDVLPSKTDKDDKKK